jgi:hypothetical protein
MKGETHKNEGRTEEDIRDRTDGREGRKEGEKKERTQGQTKKEGKKSAECVL